MNKSEPYAKGCDEWDLWLYSWDEVTEPKAVVQIFHGMAEYAGRYERFARYLNSRGYIVIAHDHRGQGKSAQSHEEIGCIGADGFNRTVEDTHLITDRIKRTYPGLPVYVFAHSFGSFVGQEYMTRFGNELAGIILSGSSAQIGSDIKAGRIVSSLHRFLFGEKKKAKLINSLSFGGFNKGITHAATPYDWLSRDVDEVKKYCNDTLCGSVFSIGFYYYLFKGLMGLYQPEKLQKIPKELPIYIMSGDQDPVGHYGQRVIKLQEIYRNTGVQDVELKLYQGGRHEMVNETNWEEVYGDIVNWLERKMKPKE